jgi:hypothetical protein
VYILSSQKDIKSEFCTLFGLGMTKVKLGKEESTSAEFVERRRASLER